MANSLRNSLNFPHRAIHDLINEQGVTYAQALVLLDLYGTIEFFMKEFKLGLRDYGPTMNELARNRGTSFAAIRRNVRIMESIGWLNFITIDSVGTDWTLHGIQRTDTVVVDLPPSVTASLDPSAVGVVDDDIGSPQAGDTTCLQTRTIQESSQEKNQEALRTGATPKKTKKERTERELNVIATWNRHKPRSWVALRDLSPSRIRSIVALGGYNAFIEQIPAFMAGAKQSKFWAKKQITWENIIGTGITPKGHFQSLQEQADQDSNSLMPRSVEHPDFFPPSKINGEMRPKHGFKSAEERRAAEEDARTFYSQQQQHE